MSLFLSLPGADGAPALTGDEPGAVWLTHGELRRQIDGIATALRLHRKGLVQLAAPNSVGAVLGYLGALAAGHAVCPLDPGLAPEKRSALAERFQPELISGATAPPGYRAAGTVAGLPLWRRSGEGGGPVHPDLALLLATSGSTGNPRFACLSGRALAANTAAIIEVLGLGPGERALAHLPLHYSYGLSVLHSHLAAGGSVVVTGRSVLDGALWQLARETEATAFAGVPFHWESLLRLGLGRLAVPRLRLFTRAGGRLAPELSRRAAEMCAAAGGRFFVMYGQTEAAPRITTLPAGEALTRPDSVGPALPGGRLEILTADGPATVPGITGEVIYYGPNVMMGYARTRAELAAGDRLYGRLATGDLGRLDADGYLTLTGRQRPFVKLLGQRLDLADIEAVSGAVAFQEDDRLVLISPDPAPDMKARVAAATGLHPGVITVRRQEIPLLPSGKPDTAGLRPAPGPSADPVGARVFWEGQHDKDSKNLPDFLALTAHHVDSCPAYRRILELAWPEWRQAKRLAALPYLPVDLFRSHALASIPANEIRSHVSSSGTTGRAVSRVPLDDAAARLQARALAAVMRSVLGPARLPMLIVDSRSTLEIPGSADAPTAARAAGILGMMKLGRDYVFALGNDLALDRTAVEAFLARHGGAPFLIYGTTALVRASLHRTSATYDFSRGILVHGGGWKRLAAEAVDRATFKAELASACALTRIYDFYGMAEQIGTVHLEDEDGLFHPPAFADVIIRDPATLEPVPDGTPGLIQVLSLLPRSYPGHSLLTGDLGVIESTDRPGTRLGKGFRVLGRVAGAPVRGCGGE